MSKPISWPPQIDNNNILPSEPQMGSFWKHHSGREYIVLFLTNEPQSSRDGKYPRTVVYMGNDNKKLWSGPLNDWHRRMTLIEGKSFKIEMECGGYHVKRTNDRKK